KPPAWSCPRAWAPTSCPWAGSTASTWPCSRARPELASGMARQEPPLQLSEHVYALTGAVNSAIVAGEAGRADLVRRGQASDHGRRVRRALVDRGLTPVAVLNTHSHADHYGGNAYPVRQYPEAVVHAPPFEAGIMRAPYLEPV